MDWRRFLTIILFLSLVAISWGLKVAHAGPGGGTYYANSPAGFRTGPTMLPVWTGTPLRKFVDSLPGLGAANANNLGQYIPVANPDTTTYLGSDYYVIGLQDYTEKLHSNLPKATKLRGYYQINNGTTGATDHTNQYLGSLILASKDRPVRIKFENHLGVGAAGDLFIPVDTTDMGAGLGPDGIHSYTQNRATLKIPLFKAL